MKAEFNFKCCCDDRFKNIYGKLIRSVKKQLGKVKFKEVSVIMYEKVSEMSYWPRNSSWNKGFCSKCKKHHKETSGYRIKTVSVSNYNIKIEG